MSGMNRPGPGRPGPLYRSLTGYFSVSLECTNLKFEHNLDIDLKILVSNFEEKKSFFLIIAFLVKPDFRHFFIHLCV